jgi:hypothetical protein
MTAPCHHIGMRRDIDVREKAADGPMYRLCCTIGSHTLNCVPTCMPHLIRHCAFPLLRRGSGRARRLRRRTISSTSSSQRSRDDRSWAVMGGRLSVGETRMSSRHSQSSVGVECLWLCRSSAFRTVWFESISSEDASPESRLSSCTAAGTAQRQRVNPDTIQRGSAARWRSSPAFADSEAGTPLHYSVAAV